MDTQCERVLKYLQENGKITQFDAMIELGVLRLAARINDLKNSGYLITSLMVKVKNRFSEDCRVAEYRMMK